MHEDEAPEAALTEMGRLLRGFQVARMIQVAAELGLADRVAGGPEPVAALAAAVGADPALLVRLCRALAAFGIFAVDEEGPRLRQTARSAWLASAARPTLHDAARYWGMPSTWEVWGGLEATVRTGVPAQEARFGMAFFPLLASRPEEAERFDAFMRNSPDDRHRAVAAAWDFSDARLVVDVGGGNGGLLSAILAAFPGARGLLFDRAHVVAGAPAALAEALDRCTVVAGDFFEAVPSGGDVYILAQILHDWSDERCAAILANCRRAMRPGARLLVVERLLGPGADPMNHLADMHMMLLFPGARERTAEEYRALLEAAGFSGFRAVPTSSPYHVLAVQALPAGSPPAASA